MLLILCFSLLFVGTPHAEDEATAPLQPQQPLVLTLEEACCVVICHKHLVCGLIQPENAEKCFNNCMARPPQGPDEDQRMFIDYVSKMSCPAWREMVAEIIREQEEKAEPRGGHRVCKGCVVASHEG